MALLFKEFLPTTTEFHSHPYLDTRKTQSWKLDWNFKQQHSGRDQRQPVLHYFQKKTYISPPHVYSTHREVFLKLR